MDSPFLRMDDARLPEILTDAAINVLGSGGIDRFSVRALARWMKVSPPAVLNDFSRARVLELIIISFEKRWLAWSGSEPIFGPAPAAVPLRLPATPDECLGVRVYSGLQQLAEAERLRDNPGPTTHLERLRDEELVLLRFRLEPPDRCCTCLIDDQAVAATLAMVQGLRLALADRSPVMTWSQACEALRQYASRATVHTTQCQAGQIAS
jgi:hypothetical protein